MKTAMKTVPIALLIACGSMWHVSATAAAVQQVCGVNGADACAQSDYTVPAAGVLTLRGYAYDMDTGDRPVATAGTYVMVRNEDTLVSYKLPITAIEARPDVIGPAIGDTTLKPENYEVVNAGFVAQVFMASLPVGRYSVQEVKLGMKKSGVVKLDLTSADQRATFQIDGASSGFKLIKPDSSVIPLSLGKASGGTLPAAGYPALRNGAYQIEATLPGVGGETKKTVGFQYKRPEVTVPVSLPLVDDFPGKTTKTTVMNPLNNRPLDTKSLPIVVDKVEGENVSIDGTTLSEGKEVELTSAPGATGVYQFGFRDNADTEGQHTVKLWVDAPDAPNINVVTTRWDPDTKVKVSKSSDQAPVKVEDIGVQATLDSPSIETCQVLRTIKTENIIGQYNGTDCAIRYEEMPEGMKHNPYQANALTGSLPVVGDNTVTYRVGVVYTDPSTNKTQFYPSRAGVSTVHLTGVEPSPIELTFRDDKLLKPFYDDNQATFPGKHFGLVDPAQARTLGVMDVKSAHRGVRTLVTYQEGETREAYTTVLASTVPLATKMDEPWQEKTVKVESWYEKAPEYKTTQTLSFVGIPLGPVVDFEKTFISHDKADTVIHGSVGLVKGQTRVFDPASMGDWQVVIRDDKTGDTMSTPVAVQADGSFEVNLGLLSAGTRYIVADASMVTKDGLTAKSSAKSKMRALVTAAGQSIEATLNVRSNSGKAPFVQTVAVNYKDPKMQPNVREVAWEQEQEDGSWKPVMRSGTDVQYIGINFIAQLQEPGKAKFRAVLTNKYSGAVFTTEPVELEAFALPTFKVAAPAVVQAKTPVTFTIEEDPGFDAEYTWRIVTAGGAEDVGPTNGKTFTFTPNEVKSYAIEVIGRQAGAPDNPAANVKKNISVRAVNPLVARATIKGPREMESGKPYEFTAVINDVVSSTQVKAYELKGYWVLPDGTRVDGTDLTYTPRPEDKLLSFYTYVDGNPDETSVSTSTFSTWTYSWPDTWQIRMQPVYLDVPASIRYYVETPGFRLQDLHGEPLTYTWSLPDGVQRTGNDSSGSFAIDKFGKYQIALQVADTRGNVTNITADEFTILPPATVDTQVSLTSKYGDDFYAPGNYYLGVKINKLPRGDSFLRNEAWVNEEKVGEFTGSGHYIAFAEPGSYDVTVRTITKSGNYGEQTIPTTVQAPPAPECEVKLANTTSGVLVTPVCTVPVGYIKSFTWNYTIDGQAQSASSKTFLVTKQWLAANSIGTLNLTVESDLGAKATQEVIYK